MQIQHLFTNISNILHRSFDSLLEKMLHLYEYSQTGNGRTSSLVNHGRGSPRSHTLHRSFGSLTVLRSLVLQMTVNQKLRFATAVLKIRGESKSTDMSEFYQTPIHHREDT